jgi:hypothetical protein
VNIKHKATEWVKLTDFPSTTSYVTMGKTCKDFWQNLTEGNHSGVYQVSLTKPKELVHKDICYIGESGCLPKRISDLRTSAGVGNKVTHHMCGVYIREECIDIESVYVRCLIVDDEDKKDLERWLHSEHRSKFNYKVGYAWEEASGGYKSGRIQIQVNIKRLNSLDACEKIQSALNERIAELKNKQTSLVEFLV